MIYPLRRANCRCGTPRGYCHSHIARSGLADTRMRGAGRFLLGGHRASCEWRRRCLHSVRNLALLANAHPCAIRAQSHCNAMLRCEAGGDFRALGSYPPDFFQNRRVVCRKSWISWCFLKVDSNPASHHHHASWNMNSQASPTIKISAASSY